MAEPGIPRFQTELLSDTQHNAGDAMNRFSLFDA